MASSMLAQPPNGERPKPTGSSLTFTVVPPFGRRTRSASGGRQNCTGCRLLASCIYVQQ